MPTSTESVQAEGIPVSPYCVRKALENTSVPIGNLPEDKLSTGEGLMQVDKLAFVLWTFSPFLLRQKDHFQN